MPWTRVIGVGDPDRGDVLSSGEFASNRGGRASGGEQGAPPFAARGTQVLLPPMHAVRAFLPEDEPVREQAVASPPRGPRYVKAADASLDSLDGGLEFLRAGDARSPGATPR